MPIIHLLRINTIKKALFKSNASEEGSCPANRTSERVYQLIYKLVILPEVFLPV